MERSAESGELDVTEINNGNSLPSDKKIPGRRLIQTTLFPHRSQGKLEENNNGEAEEFEESNGKRKRIIKGEIESITPMEEKKTPISSQEALNGGIGNENSLLTDGLQIDLTERSAEAEIQLFANGISPRSEKKTPGRRLIQSTLFPHKSQEIGEENDNEKENDEEEEYSRSQGKGKRKRKEKEKAKCKPKEKKGESQRNTETPINGQEALSGRTESKTSPPNNGLQSDLMERSVEVDKQVVVTGISPHSEKRTPRRRLIQPTLFPHRSQEIMEEDNNEEENEEDEDYCGRQSKGKRKRKGKGKTKHTPASKTPINCKDASSGRTENKTPMLIDERKVQQEGQKGADTPEGVDKVCADLEPGSRKRSTRQLKKGQRASPRKDRTPSKLKGPHCRRIMADINAKDGDIQSELAPEPTFDLRLEAKLAAEENARLFEGRQTHPFFSSWKVGKKIQGTSEATELESKQQSILHEGQPIHVFEILQENPVPLDWSNWTFCNESSLDSSLNPEKTRPFNCSVKPLKLDNFLTTSYRVESGKSLDHSSSNIYSNSPIASLDNGEVSNQQMEYLEAVQERYSVNNLDIKLHDGFVQERSKLYNPDRGSENSLWTNKYQPRKASEVCGNVESVRFLNEWLGSWRERYSRNPKDTERHNTCAIEDSDYSAEESDSAAESTEERAGLKNVLLVSGPIGSGKSAAIYACAREQGFEVIEVSASDWRNGAQIKQKFGAAMESLGLNKWSLEDPLGLKMKHILELPSTQFSKSATQDSGDDIVEVFPELCGEESYSFKPEFGIVVNDKLSASSQNPDKTLILFEDVDTVFDEDRGLIASIQQIAETAKRPMILTSNRKDPVLPDQLDRLEVSFTIPSSEDLASHVYTVCATEQASVYPELLDRFIKSCQGDIRKTIMLLQFWCQGKLNINDRKSQSTYSPLHFDLDTGHQVIPKVIPWDFPCQLSDLVEKEITKSLEMVKENASLLETVEEEEDLGCTEMQDELAMDAKKEAMLSRNHSILDGNGFSVQFDTLEDFSNSSGSPVPYIRQSGRRGLCTVLSSQSEDDIPMDLNVTPVHLCDEVFPDVSQMSLADTIQSLFYGSPDVSCVPESSFVPETEINGGVEFLSSTVSIIDGSSVHEAIGDDNQETTLGNSCEEEMGDSQLPHSECVTRRYQVMDECSRAGFNASREIPMHASSVMPETWRRLRCCHEDLKSYVTSEQRNACQIVKLASGFTDLISVSDLMFGRCQPVINDILESSSTAHCDEHLEMTSTIAQHGFCFFTKESAVRGSNSGFKVSVDLASEILASTSNTTVLGNLLTQRNSYSRRDSEVGPTRCDLLLEREIAGKLYNTIQNVVPLKMYLGVKGAALHEYTSSLGRIAKLEASRLLENKDPTRLRRRARVGRHYLCTGSLSLSPEDVKLVAQHNCFGNS